MITFDTLQKGDVVLYTYTTLVQNRAPILSTFICVVTETSCTQLTINDVCKLTGVEYPSDKLYIMLDDETSLTHYTFQEVLYNVKDRAFDKDELIEKRPELFI